MEAFWAQKDSFLIFYKTGFILFMSLSFGKPQFIYLHKRAERCLFVYLVLVYTIYGVVTIHDTFYYIGIRYMYICSFLFHTLGNFFFIILGVPPIWIRIWISESKYSLVLTLWRLKIYLNIRKACAVFSIFWNLFD